MRRRLHFPQPEDTQFSEHLGERVLGVATRWHLMTPPQEMPYTIVNVMIDRLIRISSRTVAEVSGPAFKHLIQLVPHLGPRPNLTGD